MAYADATYYKTTYHGRAASDDTTLGVWLSRASDDIDMINFGAVDTTGLSAEELEALKKATCAQAENYVINGEGGEQIDSVSLGAFSIKKSSKADSSGGVICDRAERYLSLAGIGSRGVRVCYHRSRVMY